MVGFIAMPSISSVYPYTYITLYLLDGFIVICLLMILTRASSREALQVYSLFAQRAFEFLFQPKVNALAVELVGASQCFHHLAALKVVQANCAAVFFLFRG